MYIFIKQTASNYRCKEKTPQLRRFLFF